ncbi:helix-turn-helix transcriptional regulator [Mycobacterium sp. 852013-50091_SCH5140682]|uniref:helix-turn-helix domain-containing protein n=1 Tax=Mycobacterium sp. 852013-50091_SCH5140682 TaxID=1834109 RepID=UPI0009EF1C57|nr:helix-turn-helix transcriptional regulator [Mycobacterium sp. 852013-50091_SCH5140682]
MTTSDDQSDWAAAVTKQIGAEVRRLRGKRSAQWLAERTAKCGWGISRPTISELETGKRKTVTVQELLVLAHALNTSPAALLYPGPYDREIEALPGRELTEFDAVQWFSALGYWADVPQARNDGNVWLGNTRALRLSRELASAQGAQNMLLMRGEFDRDRELIANYDDQIRRLKAELAALHEGDQDDDGDD